MKTFFITLYYKFTAYVPRRLPTDEAQWDSLRHVLRTYYGVPNTLEVWITVAGQITGTPTSRIRRSYGFLANTGKRLGINKVIHEEKQKMMKVYNDRLETLVKEQAALAKDEATDATATTTHEIDQADAETYPKGFKANSFVENH